MERTETLTDYDSSASYFDRQRMPSSIIIEILKESFPNTDDLILNVGCGTGQYEKAFRGGKNIVGLDRSRGMLVIAESRIQYCSLGNMVNMPFENGAFSGVYFMQSLHHVGANLDISPKMRAKVRKQVLSEAIRVLRRGPLLIFQRDPSQNEAIWFWKYFPRALETKLAGPFVRVRLNRHSLAGAPAHVAPRRREVKNMESANIVREIASLPPEAQRQVMDFVAFLKARYPTPQPVRKTKQTKLADEPFIGMWQDREDMQDSTLWVRGLRQREWERSV